MIRIISILTLSAFILSACSIKPKDYGTEKIVSKLLSFSFDLPPSLQVSTLPIFIKQSDSIIYTATTYDLKRLFDCMNYTQSISFHDFILNCFNQNMPLKDTCNLLASFKKDTVIFNEYIQNDFKFIINKYTIEHDDEYTLLSTSPDFGVNTTISYIFFINQYFTIFDDVDGETRYMSFRVCLNMPPKADKE